MLGNTEDSLQQIFVFKMHIALKLFWIVSGRVPTTACFCLKTLLSFNGNDTNEQQQLKSSIRALETDMS